MGQLSTKIGLLHHVGGGNLGDDATLDAVMRNIKQRWPHASLIAFTQNPEDTTKRHGIPCYPLRTRNWSFGYSPAGTTVTLKDKIKASAGKYKVLFRFLKAIYILAIGLPRSLYREIRFLVASRRIIRECDLLVVSGGGQLTEKEGPWGFPYTIFKWAMLARSVRVRCIVLNVGAGPLNQRLSKFFVTHALRLADYVSFRDEESQALVHKIGFTGHSQVFPDLAYSLDVSATNRSALGKARQQGVGIAPIPYCDPRVDPERKNQTTYDDLIGEFATFAAWLVGHSYSLSLVGTDIGVDPLAIDDLREVLHRNYNIESQSYTAHKSLDDVMLAMSAVDYVVTCRFHGVIFAHLLNKPVLAVSPHPKVKKLMSDLGLAQYCVDIDTLDPKSLAETFALLVDNADEIKRGMATSLAKFKSQLASQFDQLFLPVAREKCASCAESSTSKRVPSLQL